MIPSVLSTGWSRATTWMPGASVRADVRAAAECPPLFAAADERVVASIVSSTRAARPITPAPPGWFHRMLLPAGSRIEPYGIEPISGAPMGMLIAPRPMWIVDARNDLGIPADQRPEWRRTMQQARDAIGRVYERLGAGDCFGETWQEGGHCAGMTTAHVVAWFRKWFRR